MASDDITREKLDNALADLCHIIGALHSEVREGGLYIFRYPDKPNKWGVVEVADERGGYLRRGLPTTKEKLHEQIIFMTEVCGRLKMVVPKKEDTEQDFRAHVLDTLAQEKP